MIVKCAKCGKEFNTKPSRIKDGHGKFCSQKCRIKGFVKVNCEICGKEFEVYPYRTKEKVRFCSRKCHGVWRSRNSLRENNPSWNGGNISKQCVICGKTFWGNKYKIEKAKFCSKHCHNIWTSHNKRGANNPLWKGGITPYNRTIRTSLEYQRWRQQVFLRDNFTCQKCKKCGGDMHAHHKKPFHRLVKEAQANLPLLPIYEAAMIYTPMWDISNGFTLCIKCHRKINTRK